MVTNSGFLEVILGPMFSGKTTHIVDLYEKYSATGISTLVINHSADIRYHDTMLSTHDKRMIPCIFIDKLELAMDRYDKVEAILINEGQFFPDLYDIVVRLVNIHNKRVHICGLDGDFKRMKFGALLDLIPMCDTVTKLNSRCTNCRNPAIFSHRVTNEINQIVIGSDNYMPLCRCCYNKANT